MRMTESGRLFVMSLGTPRLTDASGLTLPCARKELAVLAYLMRRPLQQATRDALADVFWGGRGEERAKHSLRQLLHRLRPLLGDALEVSADRVRVADGAVTLDATLFEREVAAADFAGAVARWEGDFLQGAEDAGAEPYRVWLEAEREALRRRLELAFTRLSASRAAAGDAAGEATWVDRWLVMLPHNEVAHERRLEIARRGEQTSGPTPGSAALLTPDYIGGQVLGALRQCWADAEHQAAVAVVDGDDGLGKTRVCAELARGVVRGDASTVVLEGRARDEDASHLPNEVARRLFETIGHAAGVADAPSRAVAA